MKKRRIGIKILGFVATLFAAVSILAFEVLAGEDEKLCVDMKLHNKESVLTKSGSPLYTADPVDFEIRCDDNLQFFYSISVDEGKTFGRFVKMDSNNITLYPDETISPRGVFDIRFRAGKDVAEDWESDEEDYIYSDIFRVIFDNAIPKINVGNEDVLCRWLDHPDNLFLKARKETGYISRIVASMGGNVLYEEHFDATEEIKDCDFFIPLAGCGGLFGNKVLVSVEDEAGNVNETTYTYYLAQQNGGDEEKPEIEVNAGEETNYIVDVTPPQVFINEIEEGSILSKETTVEIEVDDEGYEGGTVNVRLLRSCLDNTIELPVEQYNLMALRDIRKITLSREGDYHILVTARDKAGNESVAEKKFRIDSSAPDIKISGLNDNHVLGVSSNVDVCIREMFYDTSKIDISVLRKNEKSNEYERVVEDVFKMKEASDVYSLSKLEEGEYRMVVSATDSGGNTKTEETDITVDTTPPTIGSLAAVDGRYLKSFSLLGFGDDFCTDKTKCTLSASLNNCEISENDVIIGEGKYKLRLKATDEAGNVSYDEATFIIDHTPPQIVIEGADSSGNVRMGSSLKISLLDETDILSSVSFNGRNVSIEDNSAYVTVDKGGNYKLCITASDEAGNVIDREINGGFVTAENNITEYVKATQKSDADIGDSDKNDKDFGNLLVGLFTVLSGTYGLTFRAFAGN